MRPAPIIAAALLCSVAVFFGARLGPRAPDQRPATAEAAQFAAREFVAQAAEQRGGKIAELSGIIATQDQDSDGLWIVTGTGTATMRDRPEQRIEWQTRQAWQPVAREWRLKAITITRPRSK